MPNWAVAGYRDRKVEALAVQENPAEPVIHR